MNTSPRTSPLTVVIATLTRAHCCTMRSSSSLLAPLCVVTHVKRDSPISPVRCLLSGLTPPTANESTKLQHHGGCLHLDFPEYIIKRESILTDMTGTM